MLDGLTIWLAMVGVATIAMFAFDGLCWVWRMLRNAFRKVSAFTFHRSVKSDD